MAKQYKLIPCTVNGKAREVMVDVRASLTDQLEKRLPPDQRQKGLRVGRVRGL